MVGTDRRQADHTAAVVGTVPGQVVVEDMELVGFDSILPHIRKDYSLVA